MALGYEERSGLTVRVIRTYVVLINQRHRQTDRRTDDMQSQYRALHYSASRGKQLKRCVNYVNNAKL